MRFEKRGRLILLLPRLKNKKKKIREYVMSSCNDYDLVEIPKENDTSIPSYIYRVIHLAWRFSRSISFGFFFSTIEIFKNNFEFPPAPVLNTDSVH